MRKQRHNAMTMLFFWEKHIAVVFLKSNQQWFLKKEKENCDERKRKSERTCSFFTHKQCITCVILISVKNHHFKTISTSQHFFAALKANTSIALRTCTNSIRLCVIFNKKLLLRTNSINSYSNSSNQSFKHFLCVRYTNEHNERHEQRIGRFNTTL